jgi:hypothetical protein
LPVASNGIKITVQGARFWDWEKPQKAFLSADEYRIRSYAALNYYWSKSERQREYLTNKIESSAVAEYVNFPKDFR